MPCAKPKPKRRKQHAPKYPFEMVEEARKMRKYRFTYTEIADALNDHWGTDVHWVTVRDWTNYYGRVLK